MKVGIVTIFDENLGNKLQNYAGEQLFIKTGCDVDTVVFNKTSKFKFYLKAFFQKIMRYSLPGNKTYWQFETIRLKQYSKFVEKYLHIKFLNKENKYELIKFDGFAVGSDQVWNPQNGENLDKCQFFLQFSPDNKKICLSPSIAVKDIPIEMKKYYVDNLKLFPTLAVREEEGAELLEKLLNRNVEVLIDPTLSLSRNEWEKIAKKPGKISIEKKYILTYFLGIETDEQKQYISKVAEDNNLQIINIERNRSKEYFMTGPSEFIYLIDNSELIFTDSFHGTVFSFIFDKPFHVYKRTGDMIEGESRIATMVSKFDLERKYSSIAKTDELFEHDYSVGKEILKSEQQKFLKFLSGEINRIKEK